jgi:hypothetical protein
MLALSGNVDPGRSDPGLPACGDGIPPGGGLPDGAGGWGAPGWPAGPVGGCEPGGGEPDGLGMPAGGGMLDGELGGGLLLWLLAHPASSTSVSAASR